MHTMSNETILWHTHEHEHREHSADWYWAVVIITIALAVAFVIVGNMLLSVIVVLGVGILLAVSRQEPPIIECRISRKGISAGKTFYPWGSLESFWILEHTDTSAGKILLTSKKTFMPHIIVPLSMNAPQDEIREVLTHMLHEEPQIEPFPDRLMHKLGF